MLTDDVDGPIIVSSPGKDNQYHLTVLVETNHLNKWRKTFKQDQKEARKRDDGAA